MDKTVEFKRKKKYNDRRKTREQTRCGKERIETIERCFEREN